MLAASMTLGWFRRGDWKRRRLLEEAELEREAREEAVVEEPVM